MTREPSALDPDQEAHLSGVPVELWPHVDASLFHHVGAGWRPLLLEMHHALLRLDPGYLLVQVKEKFGSLRIYLPHGDASPPSDDFLRVIEETRQRALGTCDACGAPGRLTVARHWYAVRCESCREEGSREA